MSLDEHDSVMLNAWMMARVVVYQCDSSVV